MHMASFSREGASSLCRRTRVHQSDALPNGPKPIRRYTRDRLISMDSSRAAIVAWLMLFAVLPLGLAGSWVGTWATAVFPEPASKDKLPLPGGTLRQVVRVSVGGDTVRLRLSNVFGSTPLVLRDVRLAYVEKETSQRARKPCPLTFNGSNEVSIPPGAVMLSDPADFKLSALADVSITMRLIQVPEMLTTHPGSRTTSYLTADADSDTIPPSEARKVVHWYFLSGLDVESERPAAAIVVLGDSITDGYGTTTDGNNRWTDVLARRLQNQGPGDRIAVLNQGIGGNRLLRDGLGPNILARLDRDVIAQSGARWVIVLAGINDIGTRLSARERGEPYASAADIIQALSQIIVRAHAREMIVIGGTLTPYAGAGFYWSEDGEADRQAVNQWIRTSGQFDAVIDFDAALRDPESPTRLASVFDSGDHLHPSLAGYAEMARIVDLRRFVLKSAERH